MDFFRFVATFLLDGDFFRLIGVFLTRLFLDRRRLAVYLCGLYRLEGTYSKSPAPVSDRRLLPPARISSFAARRKLFLVRGGDFFLLPSLLTDLLFWFI